MQCSPRSRKHRCTRTLAGLAAAGLIAAACGSTGGAEQPSAGNDLADGAVAEPPAGSGEPNDDDVVDVDQVEPGPNEDVLSGLRTFNDPLPELPEPTTDLSKLRSGGPPPDGIPSIDIPIFQTAESVDHLTPTAPVLAVEIDGDARAYPLDIMVWHEIVNDTVGGVPVAVQYCPLCNSATVIDRRVEGRILEFGVSGLLFNSSLVMFDRQTETLWSHFASRPLYGHLGEAELVDYPATIVGFEEWRASYPDGLVLSRRTGADRNYGANPYPGYDDVDADPFLFEGDVDGRYTAMTRVVGVTGDQGAEALAFPLLELRDAGTVTSELDGEPVVAFWVPGSASALDASAVSAGVDVGATGVFTPVLDGRTLTFNVDNGVITDNETDSTWNIFGKAVAGELTGSHLDQRVHIDTFWFAWIAFHPDSAVA
jgi:hypothetical protein